MKIVCTGSSGNLGLELQKINPEILCPKHGEVDVDSFAQVFSYLHHVKPDVVIHAAAVTDNRVVEKNPVSAIQTNIIGTANIAILCYQMGIRLIYLSTDYVYAGEHGNFTEKDALLPFNKYAWSKLGGECSVVMVKNHLIIRTSFGKNEFPYQDAFVDKWTSKDYVDRIAPLIYEAALSPLTGVLNLGTERKTLYSHAVERKPDVKGVKVAETNYFTPVDTSLNLQRWINYKGSNEVKPHTSCRVCNSTSMVKYLDLGLMPLPNNLGYTANMAKEMDIYPLQVLFCEECSLSQLSVIVDPPKMFSHYLYRSSINGPYKDHCRKMAKEMRSTYGLNEESFMIDLASNDSALLKEFKEEIGLRVLGIDPAENLVAISIAQGIPAIAEFWGEPVATTVIEKYGRADLITATNVFAHVPDMKGFLKAAGLALKSSGVIVIECPYVVDLIEKMEYDTVYQEHFSYISIAPVKKLCGDLGFALINVEKKTIHGGSVRMTISNNKKYHKETANVDEFIAYESSHGYTDKGRYIKWSDDVKEIIVQFGNKILDLKKNGAKIAGVGASAKGNVLLNATSINTDLMSYIVDETPDKIGRFSPGTGIPIVGFDWLRKSPPDYLIILAWNFAEVLIRKAREAGYKGKFIIPTPTFKIVD